MSVSLLVQIPFGEDDNDVIWVEVSDEDVIGTRLASDEDGRSVARLKRTLEQSLGPVQAFVATVITRMTNTANPADEVSLEFSLKVGGETGFIVAKGRAESVVTISATWRRAEG